MYASPFRYQGPLDPADVTGRNQLLSDLTERVTERRVTALIGPRRYGKTSVLRRLSDDLTELTTVWIDLYGVITIADLAVALDIALSQTDPAIQQPARAVAATVDINLGLVSASLSHTGRSRPDPRVLFNSLLRILVQQAARRPTLLILDEFSSISGIKGATAALRSQLQHHYSDIGLIFAGSAPSVMRTLFSDRAEPFFGQADLLTINPLDLPTVLATVGDGFAATGRDAGGLPPLIYKFTEGHPQRTMQLADACWRLTPEGKIAEENVWAEAVQAVRQTCADPSSRLFEHYSKSEQLVLRIVAAGGSPHGAAGALLDLNKNSATLARDRLLADGDLLDVADTLAVTDPMLADWLRMTLPVP